MRDIIPWRKKKKKSLAKWNKDTDMSFNPFWDDSFFAPMKSMMGSNVFPRVDISEGRKNIKVKAELPGMEAKEIDVSIDGRLLTIRGEKKQEKEEKKDSYYRMERSFGRFSRTVELPAEVDESTVEASYKRGVLKVLLKKTPGAETCKIEIKTM